jgi:hypothetical protein
MSTLSAMSGAPVVFVFNGDADGILSQHLLGLAGLEPLLRITGLKRDISLLRHVPDSLANENGIDLYVCDINVGDNKDDLRRLLDNPRTTVTWYDHHEPGDIPVSPRLKTRILNTRGTCTALLVHAAYPGSDPCWAAMAAFGDNIPEAALALLHPLGLDAAETEALREAGELINYNAHGETPDDLLFQPLDVATRMHPFRDAATFLRESGLILPLRAQLREDEGKMGGLSPVDSRDRAALYALPGEAWARRLGSTFASRKALGNPEQAQATLQLLRDGSFQVSIRAPRGRKDAPPACNLALEFPTGGGRALAAGINRLPAGDVDAFARRFFDLYG